MPRNVAYDAGSHCSKRFEERLVPRYLVCRPSLEPDSCMATWYQLMPRRSWRPLNCIRVLSITNLPKSPISPAYLSCMSLIFLRRAVAHNVSPHHDPPPINVPLPHGGFQATLPPAPAADRPGGFILRFQRSEVRILSGTPLKSPIFTEKIIPKDRFSSGRINVSIVND